MTTSFVIDRAIWLRGEGGDASYLQRLYDGKQCCLGIFAVARGITPEMCGNQKFLTGLGSEALAKLPPELRACQDYEKESPGLVWRMMEVNDEPIRNAAYSSEIASEEDREAKLTALFKEVGIDVTFTGGA